MADDLAGGGVEYRQRIRESTDGRLRLETARISSCRLLTPLICGHYRRLAAIVRRTVHRKGMEVPVVFNRKLVPLRTSEVNLSCGDCEISGIFIRGPSAFPAQQIAPRGRTDVKTSWFVCGVCMCFLRPTAGS